MGLFDDRSPTDVKPFQFKERPGSRPRSIDFNRFTTPSGKAEQLDSRSTFVGPRDAPLEFTADDIVNVREDAYRRGRSDADAEWLDRVEGAEERALAQIDGAVAELQRFELGFAEHVQAVAVPLARAFAENLLGTEIQDPDLLESMARDVIGRATGFVSIGVWVHPHTRQVLEERRRRLRPEDPEGSSVQLHEDPDLSPGDIRIVADGARIESIIAERLDRLEEMARMMLHSVEQSEEDGDDRYA